MAQLVEHNLAKVGVAGSSPVVRSIAFPDRLGGPFSAKWPSGKAEACKAFTPGSNPLASRQHPGAPAPVLFYICGHGSVGRAQPCQGWGRGFEPRCPLQTQQPDYYGSRAFSYPSLGLEPERERALSKRGAFVASWRGRRQAAEAGADPRSEYADAPLSAPTILRGSNEPRFLLTLREPRAPHLAPQSSVAYIKYASLLFRGNLGHPEPARCRGRRSGPPFFSLIDRFVPGGSSPRGGERLGRGCGVDCRECQLWAYHRGHLTKPRCKGDTPHGYRKVLLALMDVRCRDLSDLPALV